MSEVDHTSILYHKEQEANQQLNYLVTKANQIARVKFVSNNVDGVLQNSTVKELSPSISLASLLLPLIF